MLLHRGSKTGQNPSGILKHFGSLLASAQRLESMFSHSELRMYNSRQDQFVILDSNNTPCRIDSYEETLAQFVSWMEKVNIIATDVDIKNPIRLRDIWTDDPIGSGGPDIVLGNPALTAKQRSEIKALFHPFTEVVYPDHVHQAYSEKQLKGIFKKWSPNKYFQDEFSKRKERSLSIGEDFKTAAAQEIVWMDLTFKFREWAIQNNFDSFVYENEGEDNGSDAYVTLNSQQIRRVVDTYFFDGDEYLSKVSPLFSSYMKARLESRGTQNPIVYDCFWSGLDPLQFFRKDGSLTPD